MNHVKIFGLLLGFGFFPYAEGAQLKVSQVREAEGKLHIETSLQSAPAEPITMLVSSGTVAAVSAAPQGLATNLWILVDNSSHCSSAKMDKYLNSLFPKVPGLLNPDTLVSVMTYSQDTQIVLAKNQKISELGELRVDCNEKSLSNSYEGALRHLLAQESKSNLPIQLWIYSSGNVVLGSELAKELQERKISVHLSLYMPLLFTQLEPLLTSNMKVLGELYSYSLLDPEGKAGLLVPEQRLSIEFTAPRESQGGTAKFRLDATRKDKTQEVIASTAFSALVPRAAFSKWLPYLQVLSLLSLLILVYFTVRRYRVKACSSCQRELRFSDEHCLFCHQLQEPMLWVQREGSKDRGLLLPLVSDSAVLYKTRYGLGTEGSRKNSVLKIERRRHTLGDAFALSSQSNQKIKVNGRHLEKPTFLARGDRLSLAGFSITFLTGEKS